jgi:hypothetical protein
MAAIAQQRRSPLGLFLDKPSHKTQRIAQQEVGATCSKRDRQQWCGPQTIRSNFVSLSYLAKGWQTFSSTPSPNDQGIRQNGWRRRKRWVRLHYHLHRSLHHWRRLPAGRRARRSRLACVLGVHWCFDWNRVGDRQSNLRRLGFTNGNTMDRKNFRLH